jgi:hypothetical protein
MADDAMSAAAAADEPTASTWWGIGFILFAASIMLMVGIFQFFQGLGAVIRGGFYAVSPNYAFKIDTTAWGWIHMLIGILVAVAGVYLFVGKTWARIIAIIVAIVSAVSNFFFIPYYPFWSILIIALDVVIIWAIAFHGGELREAMA